LEENLNIQKNEDETDSLSFALSTFNSAHIQTQDKYVKRNGDHFHVTGPRDEPDLTCELHIPIQG